MNFGLVTWLRFTVFQTNSTKSFELQLFFTHSYVYIYIRKFKKKYKYNVTENIVQIEDINVFWSVSCTYNSAGLVFFSILDSAFLYRVERIKVA